MKKAKRILSLLLIAILTLMAASCGSDAPFTYSGSLNDNGFWKGVKALKYVELSDYSTITVPKDIHEIPDETVQTQTDSLFSSYATENQVKDRAVVDGDSVNIDYIGSVDGVAFEGGNTGGQGTTVTIGVTSYIDDFLQQLIGHKPGETFNVEVTFPQDYGQENLNGKDAIFETTINYIAESVPAEKTDAFVATNFSAEHGWNTLAEMDAGIRKDLQDAAIMQYLQGKIVELAKIKSVPDSIVKYQDNALLKQIEDQAVAYGMEMDAFLASYVGVATTEELLTQYAETNMETAEFYLIIQAIAEDAKLSVTDEDIKAFFTEYVGIDDYTPYIESHGMPFLRMNALQYKVMEYLKGKVVLE